MTRLKTGLFVTALVAGVVVVWYAWRLEDLASRDSMPPQIGLPTRPTEPSAGGSNGGNQSPHPVRLLLQPTDVAAVDAGHGLVPVGEPQTIGEYQHMGPVDPGVRDGLIANCEHMLRELERRLAGGRDSTSGEALAKEADDLYSELCLQREIEALRDGSYLTTQKDLPSPPLTIPGAEVVSTGGFIGGEYVNLTYIFPLATDRDLRDAWEYRRAMHCFDDAERARLFNARPDSERVALAKEIAAILKKDRPTQEEISYVRKIIGNDVVLNPNSGIVTVRPSSTSR